MTVKYQGSEAHHFNITEARKKAYTKKECPFCKVSMSSGCLAKHVKACLHDDVNRRDCKNCRVRLLDSNKIIFCSRSCSAIFNNNIREQQRVVKQIKCLGCGNKKDHRKSHGLFCNNTCRVDYNRTKTWEKIEAGEINGIGLRSLKRYISEKRGDKCEECG